MLDEGVAFGTSAPIHRIDAAEARRDVLRAKAEWRRQLGLRAFLSPRQRFLNPSRDVLRDRLERLADRYDFDVVSVRFLRPKQLAPMVVVRTSQYVRLARATGEILREIDPQVGTAYGRGWSYEGFFFEADDERGVPFLATYNFWRGAGGGGGQWARSEPLFPASHG